MTGRTLIAGMCVLLLLGAQVLAAGASGSSPATLASPPAAPNPGITEAETTFFEARVRPLLAKRCFACHSATIVQGGLRLDGAEYALRGGDGGTVVIAGKPDDSRLIQAVRYDNPRLRMPPTGKLPAAEIETLVEWVRRGALYPAGAAPGPGGRKPPLTIEEGRRFWSIRPLVRTQAPKVKHPEWGARRIDQYLLARMEATGLSPAPPADRRTLLRRLSFDLIGLPPTPEEVDAFVRDTAPDAYNREVERLLASPHYGERWGRHWLDLARYCDVPEEWAQTEAQPWLYRDWVVKAFNEDLRYDQFVTRQLAADEIPGTPPAELAALGFLGLSPSYWKELKLAPDVVSTVVAEEWEERINTITGTLLGLTAACARCHDHKFDPITQKDYYALAGVLASTRLISQPLLPPVAARQVLAAHERVQELETEAKRLQSAAGANVANSASEKVAELKRQAAETSARAAALKRTTPHYGDPLAYVVDTASLHVLPDGPDRTKLDYSPGVEEDVSVQLRGNPSKPGAVAPRGFLAVLSPGEPRQFHQGSSRRELGEAIFHDAAPLAARVIVNRVWRHDFGRGLVETPSNFGVQGDRPTHPELLDDLAARFIESGWSLKWLHREIVLSSAYRQASASGVRAGKDPDNLLLSHMNRRRLEVEPWRDAILAAAGTLDLKVGGPAQELSKPENLRRTVYGVVHRLELNDLLRLYDFPDPTAHCPARFETTTPLQQLYVLNSDFIGRQAAALAARVRREVPGNPNSQIRRAYQLLYSRPPTAAETEAALAFLTTPGTALDEAWQQYAEVLLARNELMFVD